MIKFYYNTAPNPTKVALCLEEMGLPYELGAGRHPQGRAAQAGVPGDQSQRQGAGDRRRRATVFDSNAILLYLAEKTGKFLPAKASARGQMLSWLMFVASGIGPYSGQSVHFRNFAPEPKEYAVNRYTFEAQRHWGILEARLGKQQVHAGRRLQHRRHGGVGLVAADPFVLGGRGQAVPEPASAISPRSAPGRRRCSPCAEGQAHLQDRDGRGGAGRDVPASGQEGGLTVIAMRSRLYDASALSASAFSPWVASQVRWSRPAGLAPISTAAITHGSSVRTSRNGWCRAGSGCRLASGASRPCRGSPESRPSAR